MKMRKYYVIFVYILQGKMGETEKHRKVNHTTKVTIIPKTRRRKYGMNKTIIVEEGSFCKIVRIKGPQKMSTPTLMTLAGSPIPKRGEPRPGVKCTNDDKMKIRQNIIQSLGQSFPSSNPLAGLNLCCCWLVEPESCLVD